jgi:hypothetical protein
MAESVRALRRGREVGEDVSVVSLSPPKKRRLSWVLVGVLLVGLAALLGAYVLTAVDDRLSIMVAARDLPPGDPITAADLRVVEMGKAGGLRAIQSHQQQLILGQAPRGPIPEGTVLNTGLFVTKELAIPAGRVVIGGAFAAGAVPTPSLAAGDEVVMLVVGLSGPAAPTVAAEATVIGTARVWAVDGAAEADTNAKVWVSLLVDEQLQTSSVQAASEGRLRLALAGG